MSISKKDQLLFTFRFTFYDGTEKSFPIVVENDSLKIIQPYLEEIPDWTKHDNIRCPIYRCPDINKEYCPIALNFDRVLKFFSNFPSYEKVTVHVETENRTYSKKTSLQEGAGSMIGIMMTTSGCPVLDKLRPMVRFHLPFATLEETAHRVFSMYLFAQFLKKKNKLKPDWDMIHLKDLYEEISKININLAKKITRLESMDTSINAVVILNAFAESIQYAIEDEDFSEFEHLYRSWLENRA